MVFLKGESRASHPDPYFLIRHPAGNVLFDGGMQSTPAATPVAYFGDLSR